MRTNLWVPLASLLLVCVVLFAFQNCGGDPVAECEAGEVCPGEIISGTQTSASTAAPSGATAESININENRVIGSAEDVNYDRSGTDIGTNVPATSPTPTPSASATVTPIPTVSANTPTPTPAPTVTSEVKRSCGKGPYSMSGYDWNKYVDNFENPWINSQGKFFIPKEETYINTYVEWINLPAHENGELHQIPCTTYVPVVNTKKQPTYEKNLGWEWVCSRGPVVLECRDGLYKFISNTCSCRSLQPQPTPPLYGTDK